VWKHSFICVEVKKARLSFPLCAGFNYVQEEHLYLVPV